MAVGWTKLSCRTFKDNQTRLQLFALAYNLANFLRRLALPRDVKHWSLTTLREKLVKIGAKVTRHSKYVTFQLAEVKKHWPQEEKSAHNGREAWPRSLKVVYSGDRNPEIEAAVKKMRKIPMR